MQIQALVFDFHGTLVEGGRRLDDAGLTGRLEAARAAGMAVVLNTSCDLGFLLRSMDRETLDLFDAVILGNGSEVLWRGGRRPEPLAPPHSRAVVNTMRRLHGVPSRDIWGGHSMIGTRAVHLDAARAAVTEVNAQRAASGKAALDLVLESNGETVTILPAGTSKASALTKVVRDRMGIPLEAVAGGGDGPRDRDFLALCGVALIPANADPALRTLPNAVLLPGRAGNAMREGIDAVLATRGVGGARGTSPRGRAL